MYVSFYFLQGDMTCSRITHTGRFCSIASGFINTTAVCTSMENVDLLDLVVHLTVFICIPSHATTWGLISF